MRILILTSSIVLFLTFTATAAKKVYPNIKPTMADVKYGPHERNTLDLYKAESDKPTPVMLYFYPGGFREGDKSSVVKWISNAVGGGNIKELLDAGISVAAVNYRHLEHKPLPGPHQDALRALQFLRANAARFNIDKERAAVIGGSAGAQIAMWLAFHDEMADPNSSDPIKRESSRVTCVATGGGQTTMDQDLWAKWIPGLESRRTRAEVYGDISDKEHSRVVKDISAMSLISADDPPIYMFYRWNPDYPGPADPNKAWAWRVHNVIFGFKLKEKMDKLGVEAHVKYPDAKTKYESMTSFLIAKLKPDSK